MMPEETPTLERLRAENADLRVRLENTEQALRDLLGGEADTLVDSSATETRLIAIKGADQSYRILIEEMGEGALTLTPEGLVLYSNRRFAEMLGVPLEKVIGSEIDGWFARETRPALQAMLKNDTLDNQREELALAFADGTEVPVYLSLKRRVSDGMSDVFYLIVTDLMEQKINSAMLADERLARAILEQAADVIVICDGSGRIIHASKQALAFSSRNLNRQLFESAFPLRRLDGTPFSCIDFSDGNMLQSVEMTLLYNGRSFIFLVNVGYLKGADDELLGSVVTMTDITESKAAELALQKSQKQLSEALTIARIGYWEYEFSTNEFIFNDQYYLLHKITAEEAGGYRMSVADFVRRYLHPDDAPIMAKNMQLAVESRDPDYSAMTEARILSGRGETIWVEVRFRIVKDHTGNTVHMIGVNQDITERKVAENKLRDSESRLQEMAENIPDAFFLRDADGKRMLYISRAYEEIFGLSCESLYANPDSWIEAIHPDDRGATGDIMKNGILAGKFEIECRIVRPDGSIRWIASRGYPVHDDAGKLIRIAGFASDITERKQAELILLESERRFTDLLENVKLVSAMRDSEGSVTYCNEYLLKLTGWRSEEVIGHDWVELFVPPEIAAEENKVFAELLLDNPETWHHESEVHTRSGDRRLIRWNNTVLRSADGAAIGTASIGEDITEQKQAEARINFLNRVYAMLSGINSLIVRAKDRTELFREACEIAVKEGGFRMAMLIMLDKSRKQLVSFDSVGMDDELVTATKNILSRNNGVQSTIIAPCINDTKAVVLNDVQSDPGVLLGKKYEKYGVHSVLVLPLIVAGTVAGIITLYANEKDFFQNDEMQLLTELAGDIAFAIDHIDKQAQLDYLAFYDDLTGLANRRLFLDRVAQCIRNAVTGSHRLAIFQIDLERFKSINDGLGRRAGDELLKQVAEWLTHRLGDSNLLARIDMDHFALVLPKVIQDGDPALFIEKTMGAFSQHPFLLNDEVFHINAKTGIAIFPDDGSEPDILLRNAEAALKNAKSSGERYLFHTTTMTDSVAKKLTLENQLRQAIDNEEFVLHYQPKLNLANNKVTSAEALIRWNKPNAGLIPPFEFIPILEETGLIHEVGRWALRKAISDNLRWHAAGLETVRIAVNVSALQLRNPAFIDEIKDVIAIDSRAASGLELEMTESLIMEDVKRHTTTLEAIRALGITIAIDDFGTGFSSLSYLARLPVDTLKIDRSFIIDMTVGPEGLALVYTIINLAHSMSLKVVAEGVETEEQSHLLHLLRCEEMQGFLLSKPIPTEVFQEKFLARLASHE